MEQNEYESVRCDDVTRYDGCSLLLHSRVHYHHTVTHTLAGPLWIIP